MEDPELHLVEDIHEIFETQGDIRGRLARRLRRVHPIDVAVSLQYLEDEEKQAVLGVLDDRTAALVLDETDEETKRVFLEHADEQRVAQLIELMPPDEGADLLELAPDEIEEEVLEQVRGFGQLTALPRELALEEFLDPARDRLPVDDPPLPRSLNIGKP